MRNALSAYYVKHADYQVTVVLHARYPCKGCLHDTVTGVYVMTQ